MQRCTQVKSRQRKCVDGREYNTFKSGEEIIHEINSETTRRLLCSDARKSKAGREKSVDGGGGQYFQLHLKCRLFMK